MRPGWSQWICIHPLSSERLTEIIQEAAINFCKVSHGMTVTLDLLQKPNITDWQEGLVRGMHLM